MDVNYVSKSKVFNRYLNALYQYVDNTQIIPMRRKRYNGVRIGNWFHRNTMKMMNDVDYFFQTNNVGIQYNILFNEYYRYMSTNNIVKNELNRMLYEKYRNNVYCDVLEYCEENTRILNEINVQKQQQKLLKKQLLLNKKRDALIDFVNINNRLPYKGCTHNNVNVFTMFNSVKKQLKQIPINELHNNEMYTLLTQNLIIKNALDTYLKINVNNNVHANNNNVNMNMNMNGINNGKRKSFNEMITLLFEFIDTNDRLPKVKENYKGANIYNWLYLQKSKIKSTNDQKCIDLSQNDVVREHVFKYLNKKNID